MKESAGVFQLTREGVVKCQDSSGCVEVTEYLAKATGLLGIGFIKVDPITVKVDGKERKVCLPIFHSVCMKYYIPSTGGLAAMGEETPLPIDHPDAFDEAHVGYCIYCIELRQHLTGTYNGTEIKSAEIFKRAYVDLDDIVSNFVGKLFRVKDKGDGSFTEAEYYNLFSELHKLARMDEKNEHLWDAYNAGVFKLAQDGVECVEAPHSFTSWGFAGDVKVSFSPWEINPDE